MFARVLALVPFALLVSAASLAARNQCQTGSISCCNSVKTATSGSPLAELFNLLDIQADVNALVGITCSPIGVGSGNGCTASQQPVCCTNEQFHGLFNLGCSIIDS